MFRNRLVLRRRWFLRMTLLAGALALGTGGILWYSVEASSVSGVQTRVAALKPVFTGARLFVIAVVATTWPFLVSRLHRWGQLDEMRVTALLALRWRIVTWLILIELILGQNLLGQMLAVLQGSRG